jgi:hypothetical protein
MNQKTRLYKSSEDYHGALRPQLKEPGKAPGRWGRGEAKK